MVPPVPQRGPSDRSRPGEPSAVLDGSPIDERSGSRVFLERPYLALFAISFGALFIELMLIRYSGSQIRIFSFYKNIPLIASFLGLGLGCFLARGGSRQTATFLFWLVPLVVFLSAGSIVTSNLLGKHAAIASTEQILGESIPGPQATGQIESQLLMAGFCVGVFVVITLLFTLLGRLLGEGFRHVPRLPGYTVNILGSLAGILAFAGVSYLQTPPWVWFLVGLAPLLLWLTDRRQLAIGAVLIAISALATAPHHGETVWSRYQKLVGHPLGPPGEPPSAYLVEISDVFYQIAVDRREAALARQPNDPFANYDEVYKHIRRPDRVLVVGAGTGNDVAAAVRAGAKQVDAVDIDPAIVAMGKRYHPERPYDDPRVRVLVDDARHVFRVLPAGSYDAVIFGLLDSHTQLGMSSVRLDNYVFTEESFAAAARLLAPGGSIVVTAVTVREWFYERFVSLLERALEGPVQVFQQGTWFTYVGRLPTGSDARPPAPSSQGAVPEPTVVLPTDDWPFLYLPERGIPSAYLWVVGCLVSASVVVLRARGLELGRFGAENGHFFLLGAAFLLMEVNAINRLALFFGTTWIVSAVGIALVLLLIVGANLTAMALQRLSHRVVYIIGYGGLALSLALSYLIQAESFTRGGTTGGVFGPGIAFGLVVLSPVYFAGLVFARSFCAIAARLRRDRRKHPRFSARGMDRVQHHGLRHPNPDPSRRSPLSAVNGRPHPRRPNGPGHGMIGRAGPGGLRRPKQG